MLIEMENNQHSIPPTMLQTIISSKTKTSDQTSEKRLTLYCTVKPGIPVRIALITNTFLQVSIHLNF